MIDFNVTKVNGDPQPPDEMNSIFAEVKTMVSSLGVAFVPGSTQQLAEAIATLVMNGQYYTDTGVANAYVLSVTPATRKAPIAYITGMIVSFISGNASTGASTVNIAGLGVKTINQADGTAIEAGDITTTGLTTLYYDGAGFRKVNDRINLAASQEVKGILPIANGGTGSALTAFCN
ncbi:MAG: hypothetical protein KAI72_07060, partial [Candidatus Pacebacteria bacterium]|nr:hypothetical protein [Candidatus Paceibacterota bacterium]